MRLVRASSIGSLLCLASLVCGVRPLPAAHPRSCKPRMPVEVILQQVSQPGAALLVEARVRAFLAVEEVQLTWEVPGVDRRKSPLPRALGALSAGTERVQSLTAAVGAQSNGDLLARVSFRLPGGRTLSTAAHFPVRDGQPVPLPQGREVPRPGQSLLDFPALEGGR